MADGRPAAGGRGALVMGLLSVLLLMWPALVNRQPFFFSDTTSYVRAADMAAHLASGGRATTAWTARYAGGEAKPAAAPGGPAARGNDVANGNIMSGRSPYFGALLWIGYVASDFWLFVAAQAAVAVLLLRLALRLFGFGPRALLGTAAALALATGLPFYDALLMPDALAGFGILAFIVLALDRGRLGRGERAFLAGVLIVSAVSHLTHILMIAGMTAVLAVAGARRPALRPRGALAIGAAAVVAGLVSVALTSAVVAHVFARPPQLVPLLTSRIIEDGPGRDYIRGGCDGGRFAVCGVPHAAQATALDFLWSTDPRTGVFMLVDPATRERLSREDTRFFAAAARAYPGRTLAAIARNSVAQMIDFRNQGVNTGRWNWDALPAGERGRLAASLSGHEGWPEGLLDAVHYAAVLAALAVLAACLVLAGRRPVPGGGDVALATLLFVVAMVVNDVLGGAISIPQYRYQARIIWLLPFLAILAVLVRSRAGRMAALRPAAAA